MRDVSIIGIGQTSVGEHWDTSLRHLALNAIKAAAREANVERVDALFVGNMLAGELSGQGNLGALIADFVGLRGVEAVTVKRRRPRAARPFDRRISPSRAVLWILPSSSGWRS